MEELQSRWKSSKRCYGNALTISIYQYFIFCVIDFFFR